MTRVRTVFCGFLLLAATALSAQANPWEHFCYGGEIRSLASHGNTVWVGSTAGLVKYDISTQEKQFFDKANSPLLSNWISALAVSPSGILWIGTYEGVYRVEANNWQLYDIHNSGQVTQGIYKIFCVSDTELWLLSKYNANHDYVYHLSGDQWSAYSSANCPIGGQVLRDLAIDAQGFPWLTFYNTASQANGISHFNGTSWISQTTAALGIGNVNLSFAAHDGSRLWFSSFDGSALYSLDAQGAIVHDLSLPPYNLYYISAMDVDAQGRLLIGYRAWDNLKRLLRRSAESWEILDPNPEVSGLDSPYALLEDTQGNIWFGTNHGMAVYGGSSWSEFDCSDSPLQSNSIYNIAIDPQDKLWLVVNDLSEEYYALIKKNGNDWIIYDNQDYPLIVEPNSLVCGSDGVIWFVSESAGSDYSIVSFDGNAWQSYDPSNSSLPEGYPDCLSLDPANQPWAVISSNDGQHRLFRLIDGNWEPLAYLLCSVRDMVFDGVGNPWLATNAGLLYINGNEFTYYNTQNSGLPNNSVTCLTYDSDRNLWIGMSSGLAKLCNGIWQVWDPASGDYPNRGFTDLKADRWGRIWGATANTGLVCFDGTEWTVFTAENSPLLTNWVSGIAFDSGDSLWICNHGQGFSRFVSANSGIEEETQVNHPLEVRLRNYPNPFNPSTAISFILLEKGPAALGIYNLRGQLVRQLCRREFLPKGEHNYVWNGKDETGREVSSGVYFARLQTRQGNFSLKLLLLK
jgi:ligand-binding sensor domain-containing protein